MGGGCSSASGSKAQVTKVQVTKAQVNPDKEGVATCVNPSSGKEQGTNSMDQKGAGGTQDYNLSNGAWLARTYEEPLEPLLPIVDSHHHLFRNAMPAFLLENLQWKTTMFGPRTCLDKPYFVAELVADLIGNNVTHTVHVECGGFYDNGQDKKHLRCVGETRKLQQMADSAEAAFDGQPKVCAGIVAHADLTLPLEELIEQLDAHVAAGKNVCGVRDQVAFTEDTQIHSSTKDPHKLSALKQGLAELEKRNLAYDCFLYHLQLSQLAELAAECPGVTIVCNHAGMPLGVSTFRQKQEASGPSDAVVAEWQAGIRALSKCSNVVMKLGGMTMNVCGFDFAISKEAPSSEQVAEKLKPFYTFILNEFGAERCMFESNFPMDKGSCSYTVLWNAFKRITKQRHCSDEEMTALFSGTAKRVYKLSD